MTPLLTARATVCALLALLVLLVIATIFDLFPYRYLIASVWALGLLAIGVIQSKFSSWQGGVVCLIALCTAWLAMLIIPNSNWCTQVISLSAGFLLDLLGVANWLQDETVHFVGGEWGLVSAYRSFQLVYLLIAIAYLVFAGFRRPYGLLPVCLSFLSGLAMIGNVSLVVGLTVLSAWWKADLSHSAVHATLSCFTLLAVTGCLWSCDHLPVRCVSSSQTHSRNEAAPIH